MYYKIPCTYLRGGTSRALFFHKRNLPEDQSLWPELFKKALGVRRTAAGLSAMGQDFPTHKVAVISPHEGPDADVDYNFFQVDGGKRLCGQPGQLRKYVFRSRTLCRQ